MFLTARNSRILRITSPVSFLTEPIFLCKYSWHCYFPCPANCQATITPHNQSYLLELISNLLVKVLPLQELTFAFLSLSLNLLWHLQHCKMFYSPNTCRNISWAWYWVLSNGNKKKNQVYSWLRVQRSLFQWPLQNALKMRRWKQKHGKMSNI